MRRRWDEAGTKMGRNLDEDDEVETNMERSWYDDGQKLGRRLEDVGTKMGGSWNEHGTKSGRTWDEVGVKIPYGIQWIPSRNSQISDNHL